jgi:hypothetical protein
MVNAAQLPFPKRVALSLLELCHSLATTLSSNPSIARVVRALTITVHPSTHAPRPPYSAC